MAHVFKHAFAGLALAALSASFTAEANKGRAGFRTQNIDKWESAQSTARPAGTPNSSRIVQDGNANGAGVLQTGSGNTAGILQFGRGNTGTVLQDGSNNAACLVQSGRNLDGSIQQVGNNQTTGILQHRWGAEEIPVEVCATATTRREALSYGSSHPRTPLRPRVRLR